MQLLHEIPVLDRQSHYDGTDAIAVGRYHPTPALRALTECGLADQVEQIKLVPDPLSSEEMSKLWTAVQSHYRPSAAYVATVVLIESQTDAVDVAGAEPWSRRPHHEAGSRRGGAGRSAPPFPTIQTVTATNGQPAATVGSTVDPAGHHLDGTNRTILLSNGRFGIDQALPAAGGGAAAWCPSRCPSCRQGVSEVALQVIRPGESDPRTSNVLALVVGPDYDRDADHGRPGRQRSGRHWADRTAADSTRAVGLPCWWELVTSHSGESLWPPGDINVVVADAPTGESCFESAWMELTVRSSTGRPFRRSSTTIG